jgi:hypothetical protein
MRIDSEPTTESAWRTAYLTALFESDPAKLLERIAEAKQALYLRERELWYSGGDHAKEKLALTGAMRALEALRTIHEYPRRAILPAARPGPDPLAHPGNSTPSMESGVQGGGWEKH